MTTPGGEPARPRTEPVLAAFAAVSALLADLLGDAGGVWVVLDLGAVAAATAALAMLLRALSAGPDRPWLAELGTATTTAGISFALVVVAGHGPQSRVGSLLLDTAAAMGTVLTVLLLLSTGSRYRRERRSGGAPAPRPEAASAVAAVPLVRPVGRATVLVTAAAAAVAVGAVARDVLVR